MKQLVQTSKATLGRLPFYYRTLNSLAEKGRSHVSSRELGSLMRIDPAQVRRDLSSIGEFGKAGIGYSVPDVLDVLEQILGLRNRTEAVLVGVGRLGAALCRYPGFEKYGLRIVGLFDSDPSKIGTKLDGLPILDVAEVPHVVRRLAIQMGIVTVPGDAAQAVTDLLVSAGIIAIWNFAPVSVRVPPGVFVRDEDLAAGLSHLSRHLSGASGHSEQESRTRRGT
ncbi:MAG: redox-sensing transcriptional repressor Rex [Firmicutes bacterium]|nr:redox-sensing transcriptional repressor Rex [Bacillota bacterium]